MRGIWLENRRLAVRDDLGRPEPPPGEVLVRVLIAGICNTDLELVRGYYPFTGVLGHEFVGVVVDGPADLQGQRVVGEINASCRHCPTCQEGRQTHCPSRTVLGIVGRDGAFAEFLSLPAENLHAVPDSVATEEAVFAEPLAAALQIRWQVEMPRGSRVLVVGDGKLGQLVARSLALAGAEPMVIGRHQHKLQLLRDRGIACVATAQTLQAEFDLAIECTGNPQGFDVARKALRPRGTLVLKSTYADHLTLDAAALVVDEITLVGSRCGAFPPALAMLEEGRIGVADMIHARYPLSEGLAAFEHAAQAGVLKVLLESG